MRKEREYAVSVVAYGGHADIKVKAFNQKEAKEKAIDYAMGNIEFSSGASPYRAECVKRIVDGELPCWVNPNNIYIVDKQS